MRSEYKGQQFATLPHELPHQTRKRINVNITSASTRKKNTKAKAKLKGTTSRKWCARKIIFLLSTITLRSPQKVACVSSEFEVEAKKF